MKKVLVVVLVVLLLGGGAYYLYKHMKPSMQPMVPATSNSGNVFTSIQDALSRSLSLTCDYTDANGVHTIAYIKNGEVRADVTGKTSQDSGSVLIKDKKMYYWNTTMGMMMDMPSVTLTPGASGSTQANTGATTMNSLEQYKKYCKVATVSDSVFDLPTNVKFTDESQMMKQMPTTVMPTGSTGGYAVPTQYQQYMPH